MARYMRVRWIHGLADEPTLNYSEMSEGIETQEVETFPDWHFDFASADASNGSTFLAHGLLPTVDDLALDPEFEPEAISRDEFEI